MESKELKFTLEQGADLRVLEHGVFGRKGPLFVRVDSGEVRKALAYFRDRFAPRLEWLEHLSASDRAGAVVLSYFLRPVSERWEVVIQCALEPGPDDAWVSAHSVADLFAPAAPMEAEIQDLFGIRFSESQPLRPGRTVLPSDFEGFPMRKGPEVPT